MTDLNGEGTLMTFLILFTVFYIIPAVISYFGVRHQYKYEWTSLSPDIGAFAMVFVPMLNWGYAIFTILNIMAFILDSMDDKVENSKVAKKIEKDEFGKKFFNIR